MTDINVPFCKMNGLGNRIIVADLRENTTRITANAAVTLNAAPDMQFDQIMEVSKSADPGIDALLRILNSDGSEAEACGNGTRCVVSWFNRQTPKETWVFGAPSGILRASHADDDNITVDMGVPRFGWEDIPLEEAFHDTTGIELQVGPIDNPVLHTPSVANMGNPHCIFWVPQDVWSYELDRFGPLLEYHPVFADRANISIANVASRDHIILRTWERGAGLTEACGSAACAALVCAVQKNLTERSATVTVPGGDLRIDWTETDRVLITGPAAHEFFGSLNPVTGDYTREAG